MALRRVGGVLVILCASPGAGERLEGHVTLAPMEWALLAVTSGDSTAPGGAGDEVGRFMLDLELDDDVETPMGVVPSIVDGQEMEERVLHPGELEVLLFTSANWTVAFGSAAAQPCSELRSVDAALSARPKLDSAAQGVVWRSRAMALKRPPAAAGAEVWFLVLSACKCHPSSASVGAAPASLRWRTEALLDAGGLAAASGDLRLAAPAAILLATVAGAVAAASAASGGALRQGLALGAAADAFGSTLEVAVVGAIAAGRLPSYGALGVAALLDALGYAILGAVALALLLLAGWPEFAVRDRVTTVGSLAAAWIAGSLLLSLLVEPYRVGPVPLYLHRSRVDGDPVNGASLCVVAVWLVLHAPLARYVGRKGKNAASRLRGALRLWFAATSALLGRHILRLVASFLGLPTRLAAAAVGRLFVVVATYALIHWGLTEETAREASLLPGLRCIGRGRWCAVTAVSWRRGNGCLLLLGSFCLATCAFFNMASFPSAAADNPFAAVAPAARRDGPYCSGPPQCSSEVHVCFCSDLRDLRQLVVAINSTWTNARDPARLVFHVITSSELANGTDRLLRGSLPHVTLDIAHDADLEARIAKQVVFRKSSGARKSLASTFNFAPFYLDAFLGVTVGRLIYFDTDVVVMGDVGELHSLDLGGKAVGAVEDCSQRLETYIDFLQLRRLGPVKPGLSEACVFNRGVFVIDVAKWREQRLTAEVEKWVKRYGESQRDIFKYGVSQPPWLLAVHGHYRGISPGWNCRGLSRELLSRGDVSALGRHGLRARQLIGIGGKRVKESGDWIPFVTLCSRDAQLLHFNGPGKPWKQQRPERCLGLQTVCLNRHEVRNVGLCALPPTSVDEVQSPRLWRPPGGGVVAFARCHWLWWRYLDSQLHLSL